MKERYNAGCNVFLCFKENINHDFVDFAVLCCFLLVFVVVLFVLQFKQNTC